MITDEEFLRISAYMKQHYGIDLSQKKVIVNGRLEKHIKGGGWRNFNDFMDAVEKEPSGAQAKTLVNLLTFFLRFFDQFDYFMGVGLPVIKKKENARKDVRIWCGAASTGEEPYMIAMVLSDFFGLDRSHWDTKLLATDISTKVLKQAIAGVYTADKLEKLPPAWKKHFFQDMGGGQYRVKEELKKEVLFRQFNLMEPFPFKKKMHTIFLRNVMIYFDEKTKRELVRKVYNALEPGGYLFIGTTETLDRDDAPFQIIQPSVFRKKEG